MDKKYYLDKLYICNFKPFAYIDNEDKPFYEINFNSSELEKSSIIFTGPNGYGKSSIFQSVEFALMGECSSKSYRDRIRSINEHIFVNNLDKPCFVALQLKSNLQDYITIIRYAKKGVVGSTVEAQRSASDFCTYLFSSVFDYNKFIKEGLKSNFDSTVTIEHISTILGVKNIQEWLRRNYISQEQENAFIMQKDGDRVDLLKSFIDTEAESYFKQFEFEKEEIEENCKELEKKIADLAGKINREVVKITGEKPVCGKVVNTIDYIWDREQYNKDAPFREYAEKAKRTLIFINNIEFYRKHRCIEVLSDISSKEEYFTEYILLLFEQEKVIKYKSLYQKRLYLLSLIENEDNFFGNYLNKTFLSNEQVKSIEALRQKRRNYQGLLDEKQHVYKQFEKLHKDIAGKESIIAEVFSEECPLCGSSFKENEQKLADKIKNTAKLVKSMQNMLNTTLNGIGESISNEYQSIKKSIKLEIESEQHDEEIYKSIENLDKHCEILSSLKNEFIYLYKICNELSNTGLSYFADSVLFNEHFKKVENVKVIAEELRIVLNRINFGDYFDENIFDTQAYLENKNNIEFLKKEISNKNNIERKIKQLEWHALEQEANEYSKNKIECEKLSNKYREKMERIIKLDKILDCQKNAKKKYMENVARYLEIPLYIYSGKLMQTSLNELGITCYTGDKEYELTQFKITAGQDNGKKKLDITEKFSSGQRAVANIALILALKKIAATNLDVFMIDDPCQSLDELNIASFVEIIKNEFKNTQLILSTHEDKIAAYIIYKFQKAHKKMSIFNVQERLYNIKE